MDQAAVARHRLEAMEVRTGLALPSCDAAASAGTWRHKLPAARMAPGGSRTALRLTSLYPLAPWGPLAWPRRGAAVCLICRTAGYGPVRPVVWEGRSRETLPIPIIAPQSGYKCKPPRFFLSFKS